MRSVTKQLICMGQPNQSDPPDPTVNVLESSWPSDVDVISSVARHLVRGWSNACERLSGVSDHCDIASVISLVQENWVGLYLEQYVSFLSAQSNHQRVVYLLDTLTTLVADGTIHAK